MTPRIVADPIAEEAIAQTAAPRGSAPLPPRNRVSLTSLARRRVPKRVPNVSMLQDQC
jgi:hypothetical protein